MEHKRVIDLVRERARVSRREDKGNHTPLIVADMMAGVGPFAIPLAMTPPNNPQKGKGANKGKKEDQVANKKRVHSNLSQLPSSSLNGNNLQIHANDLNPASYTAMLQNAALNKIKFQEGDGLGAEADSLPIDAKTCQTKNMKNMPPLFVYNQCGRAFLRSYASRTCSLPHEIVMNLPANATDFLDAMVGLATLAGKKKKKTDKNDDNNDDGGGDEEDEVIMPRVHVYGFSSEDDGVLDMAERACAIMGCSVSALGERDMTTNVASPGKWSGHLVRDVAPKKLMICLSFYLPEEVAFAAPPSNSVTASTASKQRRTEIQNRGVRRCSFVLVNCQV